jgi:hypothetical protein
MLVSWQVPKFQCSDAATKGNGIWDHLQMEKNLKHKKDYYVMFD